MRQTFLVELEWLAGDIPYSEGDLLEQLRTVFGREYDNEIYSVKEVLPKVEPLEMPVVPSEELRRQSVERDDLPSDPGIAAQAESRSKRRCTCPEAAIVPCVIHKSGTPSWIGEIDGKRYTGLGNPESGPLSHLPEGSH